MIDYYWQLLVKKKIKWWFQIKTNNNLPPKSCCENFMNITLFKKYNII